MKHLLLLIILFSVPPKLFSQDTIIKYNGDKILGKVMEITPLEVRYKKMELPEGPVFVDYKGDINVIIFQNGVKEHFEKTFTKPNDYYVNQYSQNREDNLLQNKLIPFGHHNQWNYKKQIINEHDLMLMFKATNNPEIITLVNRAKIKKRQQYVGFSIFPLTAASILFGVYSEDHSSGDAGQVFYGICSAVCLTGGIGSIVYDITVSAQRRSFVSKAVKIYNEKY